METIVNENFDKIMTIEEYNQKLAEAENSVKLGNLIDNNDVLKEIETWIKYKKIFDYKLSTKIKYRYATRTNITNNR